MCGIGGWLELREPRFGREQLRSILRAQHHRGPDDSGWLLDRDAGIGLAHNRLSIIDLSKRGRQPMTHVEAGNSIVFNGEIYNFRKLRSELKDLGYKFNSETDTEVLLKAFSEWGVDCVHRLQGMFAFGVWSATTRTLNVFRDPMGIKPLYYWCLPNNGGLVFASEIKSFFPLPGFCAEVDRDSLNQFLEFGYTFNQSSTILKGLKKLPPGHRLELREGGETKLERYYYPEVSTSPDQDRLLLEQKLHSELDKVIREQLVADVPIGILLSGGLDSGIIAAMAARHVKVRTFTFGFDRSGIDERCKGRLVSQFIGSEHEEFVISAEETKRDIDQSVRVVDDLFADWGTFATRIMYEKCRERGIKVVLVGEGADELFAGYWRRFSPSLEGEQDWRIDWRLFKLYRVYVGRRYGKCFWAYRQRMRHYLRLTKGNFFDAIRLFESREQLSNNFVMKVDKASMSASVEARVPFLDRRVVELAYSVPRDFLIDEQCAVKSLLSSMAARYNLLPQAIIRQRKMGIGLPPEWMDESEDFREFAYEIILDANGWVDELGFRDAMMQFFDKGKQGYRFPKAISIFRNLAWRLLLLNLWSNHYGVSPSNA